MDEKRQHSHEANAPKPTVVCRNAAIENIDHEKASCS